MATQNFVDWVINNAESNWKTEFIIRFQKKFSNSDSITEEQERQMKKIVYTTFTEKPSKKEVEIMSLLLS